MQGMAAEKTFTEHFETLGALLRTSLDNLTAHNYRQLAEQGFTDIRPAHGNVFRYIGVGGAARVADLAARAGITKQSMGELVAYLARAGYVEVGADPADARAKLVRLTERGLTVVHSLIASTHAYEASCAEQMGAKRWREFRSLLVEFAGLPEMAGAGEAKRRPTTPASRKRRRATA